MQISPPNRDRARLAEAQLVQGCVDMPTPDLGTKIGLTPDPSVLPADLIRALTGFAATCQSRCSSIALLRSAA